MDIDGLVEFLTFFKEGGELSRFEVISVEEYDKPNMRYRVTIAYGPLLYLVTSWMPAKMLRENLAMLAREVTEEQD